MARAQQGRDSRRRALIVGAAPRQLECLGGSVLAVLPDGNGGIVVMVPPTLVEMLNAQAELYRDMVNARVRLPVKALRFAA